MTAVFRASGTRGGGGNAAAFCLALLGGHSAQIDDRQWKLEPRSNVLIRTPIAHGEACTQYLVTRHDLVQCLPERGHVQGE